MTLLQRIALGITAAIGLVVGVWAYGFPRTFYDTFPGLLGHWIDLDGPFNEHLIRDVGALYLGLVAASAVALTLRHPTVVRALGVGWVVFGLLHLAYHATHLAGLSAADAAGNLAALIATLLLALVLLLPTRRAAAKRAVEA